MKKTRLVRFESEREKEDEMFGGGKADILSLLQPSLLLSYFVLNNVVEMMT